MIKIILCDDDIFTLNIIEKLLKEAIMNSNIEAEVICKASSMNEVKRFLENNPGNYLYFMDLDLGQSQMNGIDISRYIRKNYVDSKIVFVTSHREKGIEILQSGVEPFGFIEKSVHQNQMISEYKKYLQMVEGISNESAEEEPKFVKIPLGLDEFADIPIERILYVEAIKAVAHNICYHTVDGSELCVRDTIQHAMELLGDDFLQSHRSVIVNKKCIIGIETGQIKLLNGQLVDCSLRKIKTIKEICLKN